MALKFKTRTAKSVSYGSKRSTSSIKFISQGTRGIPLRTMQIILPLVIRELLEHTISLMKETLYGNQSL